MKLWVACVQQNLIWCEMQHSAAVSKMESQNDHIGCDDVVVMTKSILVE